MYYDAVTTTIYVHLRSVVHPEELLAVYGEIQGMARKQFQSWFEKRESHFVKAMLYVFLLSHSVVIVHPTSTFDTTYLRMLQTIQKLKTEITYDLDSYVGSSFNWFNNGVRIQRVATDFRKTSPLYPGRTVPKLHFFFQEVEVRYPHQSTHFESSGSGLLDKDSKVYQRMQQAMETQISTLIDAAVEVCEGNAYSFFSPLPCAFFISQTFFFFFFCSALFTTGKVFLQGPLRGDVPDKPGKGGGVEALREYLTANSWVTSNIEPAMV